MDSPPVQTVDPASGFVTIRRMLVDSATNFLASPRLSLATVEQKRRFLREKGLTADEIDLAVQLAQGHRPSTELADEINQIVSGGRWNQLFGAIHFCLVLGGFLYGAHWFVRHHLLPWVDGQRFRKPRSAEQRVCDRIDSLQEQMAELTRNLVVVHEFVRTYCQLRDDSMCKLQNELSSIKGLLVHKDRFPAVPTVPSWSTAANLAKNTAQLAKDL